jgi:1,4-alpha-glucan branching enzyme
VILKDMDEALLGPREAVDAVRDARSGDPFALLGPHRAENGERIVRAFFPGAHRVEVLSAGSGEVLATLGQLDDGFFTGTVPGSDPYVLRIEWPGGTQETEDPYSFGELLGELDLHLFSEGTHREIGRVLGAQIAEYGGVRGVRFAVWAPNARRVSVIGDFNNWDGRRNPMRLRHSAGIWELFMPRLQAGARYKYEILGADGGLHTKADPMALATEMPPATASVVLGEAPFRWSDDAWMADRAARQTPDAPISIYELHPGSWIRNAQEGGRSLRWPELADRLIPYVRDLGFTHIELMPVTEHPFGGSWGYQPLGMYAPTARFGTPAEFAGFVDRCHAAGIGVIVDWVPAHFPSDPHGLAHFDGTALYEHADPREGYHQDWNTLIYNFGRNEVSGFLIGSALDWLERYHIDGLRVDAVASMLYRDYSRKAGEWVPNVYGGRENLEAVGFLKHFNSIVHERHPGVMTIAEESTAWPGVTNDLQWGGLGFTFKWNMGWMHDTLRYVEQNPIHRQYHHDDMTFGMVYAFSEKFVLPLSHDEVVHGKGSLLGKMPGDEWQRFANLRAYFGFMWGHPGKKLLFTGGEIAQGREWNHDGEIDWHLLDYPLHRGMQQLVSDLNRAYRERPALFRHDADPSGFRWTVGDDRANSVFAFLRLDPDGGAPVLVVSNMTPVPRENYRIGVSQAGGWSEFLNTDAKVYGGSNIGNGGRVEAEAIESHGQPYSLSLTLPPLATIYLSPEP